MSGFLTAAHPTQELFEQALAMTQQIQDESRRATALRGLAPHMPEDLLEQALAMTQQMQDESSRAVALSGLALHLPQKLFEQAATMAYAIKEGYYRADALKDFLDRMELETIDAARWQQLQLLHELAYRRRQDFIENLPKLAPAIIQLGGKEALQGCVDAMEQVCRWWP